MIAPQSLENLKQQIDIVDIVGTSIEIKKYGANFKACCPFHGEKTPSLVISPAKQIYHCFGCGVGGDAIKFVQDYKKVSFYEAVEEIADFYNFTLTYDNKQSSKAQSYKSIMEAMTNFYKKSLREQDREYLHKRGLTDETIEAFDIGYAPRSDKQIQFMTQNFLNLDDAIDVGILAQDGERRYARFTNRIMFPIKNQSGRVVGFSGRIIEGEGAKYINSPSTKYFDKSRLFYGYSDAKDSIYKKGTIVITEGNIDVPLMHQAGIKTTVATLGTALTEHHIPMIKRTSAKVLLAYDGDSAGINAAFKASVLLSRHEVDGGVVFFPDGADPADMISYGRTDELISIMKKPTALIKFALGQIVAKYDISNPYDKNRALAEATEFLRSLPSVVVANGYKMYLAEILKMNPNMITLGQVQNIEPQINTHENKAKLNIQKTLYEKPELIDKIFMIIDYDVLVEDDIDRAIIESNLDDVCLIPLKIRDDLTVYDEEEFVRACRLKQKDYIKKQIDKLTNSNDVSVDTFNKIGKLQIEMKRLAG